MSYSWDKIGMRIKIERTIEMRISQTELAEKIADITGAETKYTTVAGWEKGKPIKKVEQLTALCTIFQCDMAYLLCESDCKRVMQSKAMDITGLSAAAISKLITARRSEMNTGKIVSAIIENDVLMSLLSHYVTSDYGNVSELVRINDAINGKSHDIIVRPDMIRRSEETQIFNELHILIEKLRNTENDC